MDAITLLKNDHKTVEDLFKKFEKAGERATKTKRDLVDRMIKELSIHAVIEEEIFYPAVRQAVPDVASTILESLEEHHVVKWTLSELDGMSPEDERFDAKTTVLMESVRHHVKEEQDELFPQVREALGRKVLGELGDAMADRKKNAPTRPHPKAPDTPPGNVVAGAVSAILDRARDAGEVAVGEAKKRAARARR
jgi:hemerythrin superfamily protein